MADVEVFIWMPGFEVSGDLPFDDPPFDDLPNEDDYEVEQSNCA